MSWRFYETMTNGDYTRFSDLPLDKRKEYVQKFSAWRRRYMYFAEYQALARRTQNPDISKDKKLKHALCGLMSEVGEIASHFQKEEQGHKLVTSEVAMEMGDVLWFVAELCDVLGYDMETVAKWNIEKLKERYPAGFSAEASIHRKV